MFDPAPASLGVTTRPSDAMRILVIDDDPIYRETARMFLTMFGRKVTLAENGTAGLACARDNDFDVMIVDLEMPDMTGLEVIAATRRMERHRDLPIVMVTSRDDARRLTAPTNSVRRPSSSSRSIGRCLITRSVSSGAPPTMRLPPAGPCCRGGAIPCQGQPDFCHPARNEDPVERDHRLHTACRGSTADRRSDRLKEHLEFVRESGERLMASFLDMSTYSDLLAQKTLDQTAVVNPTGFWVRPSSIGSGRWLLRA